MDGRTQMRFDPQAVPTPCFVLDEGLLKKNLEVLDHVQRAADCRILLALKGFAMFSTFPLIREVLHGVCASSPHEARLGREEFAGGGPEREVHAFAAAYSESDIRELCATCDHIVFNSFAQLSRFRPLVRELAAAHGRDIELAVRVNPQHSEGAVPIYDPCAPGSRLGIRRELFGDDPVGSGLLDGVSGLHWHNLCEQGADCLQRTIRAVEAQFADVLPHMRYVNFGGGHHITREDYDVDLLIAEIRRFRRKWGVEVYLEPGEAVALNTGYLVTQILDVVPVSSGPASDRPADGPDGARPEAAICESAVPEAAIMDASVAAHMPDVIEMPYRPHVIGSAEQGEKPYQYRIGGLSCLSGDVAGVYSFDQILKTGDRIVFTDMAIYSMVKTNTFNGVQLPSIAIYHPESDSVEMVRSFGYEDFRDRLS